MKRGKKWQKRRERREQGRQRLHREPDASLAGVDVAALEVVSQLSGFVEGLDGQPTVVVTPTAADPDQMEFDRAICSAGLKSFVRPRLPSDNSLTAPNGYRIADEWIFVREISPGVRVRTGLSICWPDQN